MDPSQGAVPLYGERDEKIPGYTGRDGPLAQPPIDFKRDPFADPQP